MAGSTAVAGLESLGASYDVFGLYANPASTGRTVIDLGTDLVEHDVGGQTVAVPKLVQLVPIDASSETSAEGLTITKFQSSFSENAGLSGSYGFFSGSIGEAFSKTVTDDSTNYFWQFAEVIGLWKLILPPVDQLQSCLDPTFADALANQAPAELFANYYPYFVSTCTVGGAAIANAYLSSTEMTSVSTATAEVSAGFGAATGFGTVTSTSDLSSLVSKFNVTVTTSGGAPVGPLQLGDQAAFQAWAESVKTNPVLVAFETDSLVGIWELCADQTRQDALQQYYQTSILPLHPALAPATSAPSLTGLWLQMTPSQRTWDDKGSGADMNGDFYQPPVPAGWFAVGAYAQGGNTSYAYGSPVEFPVLLVQPSDLTALADPVGWTAVWSTETIDDKGFQRFTFWQANPPPGYVALGAWIDIDTNEGGTAPAEPVAGLFKCVRQDLATAGTYSGLIWWDKHSGHKGDVALYAITATSDEAITAHTFTTLPNYDSPTPESPAVYCLTAQGVAIQES